MQALEQKWVMACVDGSEMSDSVVDYSAWIAQKVNSPLELVHSIEHSMLLEHTDHSGNLTPNMRENLMQDLSDQEQSESKRLIEQGKVMLEKAKSRIAHFSIKEVAAKQRHGNLAETLSDLEGEIRVLVLGLRGQGHADEAKGIGSQLEASIRALHKPIFIVNGNFKEPKSMMLAYNDTEGANKALDMVCKSPLYRDMQIHLVHVSDKPDAQTLLDQAATQLKQAGLSYQVALLNGDAQTELLNYQDENNLDMTVMGAFSHGKLRSLFFGSFTLKMLEHNSKPVLLLR
ncbi:universal stress protein [Thiomicrospira pelophila]|uniref:universal stress protein n=1 Tax=Thiomicrospira pelophila TaxID=934 RepID=UPI0004A726B4|nr:universal stress protein [Thiomicrospira pelophila]